MAKVIRQMLLEEHSRQQCQCIAQYIGDSKTRFKQLMELFGSSDVKLVQRAAWPLSHCVEQYPTLIQPYYNELVSKLETPFLHPAVYRNITRLLQYVTIPVDY